MTTEAEWEVPEPISTCDVRLDDYTVTTVRQHGNASGSRLLFCHGNGLASDLYYPFWSLFADDCELFVYDIRNHGWNTVNRPNDHNIPTLIHDHDLILDTIDHVYGCKPTIGVFHSLSTIIPLLSFTEHYSAMVLFDPPLCKPGASQVELLAAAEKEAGKIRRRGHRFRSREEFADFLRYIPAFTRVVPGVRELMAVTTLRRTEYGEEYELRCPREYEAQLMDYARSFFPLIDLELISCPAKIIGADPTLPYSYLPTFDFSDVMKVDYDFIPEATHLLQLERPEECAAATREFLSRHNLA
ncbi:MAG: alpha/beta hydrolase [Albidovulum sp.]|nr:alpha/beta hydrolase [Albidovulum sp.]